MLSVVLRYGGNALKQGSLRLMSVVLRYGAGFSGGVAPTKCEVPLTAALHIGFSAHANPLEIRRKDVLLSLRFRRKSKSHPERH